VAVVAGAGGDAAAAVPEAVAAGAGGDVAAAVPEAATRVRRRLHGWPSTTAAISSPSTITASTSGWWLCVAACSTVLPLRVAVAGGAGIAPGADPEPEPELDDLPGLAFGLPVPVGAGVEAAGEPTVAAAVEPGRNETVETSVPPPEAGVVRAVLWGSAFGVAPDAPQPLAAAVTLSAINDACSSSDSRWGLTCRMRAAAAALRAGPPMPARRSSSRSDRGPNELRQPRSRATRVRSRLSSNRAWRRSRGVAVE
jgi:hypothetical protein